MNTNPLKIFMGILTFYILFADDIKMVATNKSEDLYFSIIILVVMIIFSIEIMLNIYISNVYFCGLYFWIDFLGTLSLLCDIHWINEQIVVKFSDENNISVNQKSVGIVRLARGLRLVMRSVTLLKQLRILKLLKSKNNKKAEDNIEEDEDNLKEESKVGQKLEELTLKRVIVLVFFMLIAITFFNPNFYFTQMTVMDFGIKIFNDFGKRKDNALFNLTFDIYIKEQERSSTPILYASAYELKYGDINQTNSFRTIEMVKVSDLCYDSVKNSQSAVNYSAAADTTVSTGAIITQTSSNTPSSSNNTTVSTTTAYSSTFTPNECIAIFNNRSAVQFTYLMNIVKTLFILIILYGGIICFTKDTNDLVLEPIAKITQKMKRLSKNPIAAMQNNDNEEGDHNSNDKKSKRCCYQKKKEAPLETVILEKTIGKIGALLALGFGEAGAEIISQNMQTKNGVDGDVNPMIEGKKVMAIYGFCDIRNFTDTTEVLQEKVMIFVNEIAEIVHEITSDYCGSANKNIGDAFLLVWKFDEKFVKKENGELKLIECPEVSQIVDMALIAFLKIIFTVHKSPILNKYREHEGLLQRIKNYCVKMGFGLHLGYSIEGAIGSMFKIDASYLSPNVNMASKLEEKTKEYGAHLVISDDFYKHMSKSAQKYARKIDQIRQDSKEHPVLCLYTVDIDLNAIPFLKALPEEKDKEDETVKKMDKVIYKLIINS
jgi:class 3 adenylate cyclase